MPDHAIYNGFHLETREGTFRFDLEEMDLVKTEDRPRFSYFNPIGINYLWITDDLFVIVERNEHDDEVIVKMKSYWNEFSQLLYRGHNFVSADANFLEQTFFLTIQDGPNLLIHYYRQREKVKTLKIKGNGEDFVPMFLSWDTIVFYNYENDNIFCCREMTNIEADLAAIVANDIALTDEIDRIEQILGLSGNVLQTIKPINMTVRCSDQSVEISALEYLQIASPLINQNVPINLTSQELHSLLEVIKKNDSIGGAAHLEKLAYLRSPFFHRAQKTLTSPLS